MKNHLFILVCEGKFKLICRVTNDFGECEWSKHGNTSGACDLEIVGRFIHETMVEILMGSAQ